MTRPARSRRTVGAVVGELQHEAERDEQGEGLGFLRENSFLDGVELVGVDHARGIDGAGTPVAWRRTGQVPVAEPLAYVIGRALSPQGEIDAHLLALFWGAELRERRGSRNGSRCQALTAERTILAVRQTILGEFISDGSASTPLAGPRSDPHGAESCSIS
ncbi:hypothetical protein [Sorangium sp. So ce406]|uniref:hypothetical protein n=1 Tax=Sorangium sp. So ce406 TaxID=3133311 RepID=UPI003F5B7A11